MAHKSMSNDSIRSRLEHRALQVTGINRPQDRSHITDLMHQRISLLVVSYQ